jgi:mevalonate kinase
MTQFRANGKLLLTGEYAVLDGALALALPAKQGQTLHFEPGGTQLHWRSYDVDGACWFEAILDVPSFFIPHTSDAAAGERLVQILRAAQQMNPDFAPCGTATTRLEFSRHWGLGTSSTLIANVAAWAGVDAYRLLEQTFGGSGYDVACATAPGPILFQLRDGQPTVARAAFHPPFSEYLWLVYLGKKQDSREGIRRYREHAGQAGQAWVDAVSRMATDCVAATQLSDFEWLLREHERLIGEVLGLPPVQSALFPDYQGTVKSLGAWGGDFVLAAAAGSPEETRAYFQEKGLGVVLSYEELIGGV